MHIFIHLIYLRNKGLLDTCFGMITYINRGHLTSYFYPKNVDQVCATYNTMWEYEFGAETYTNRRK